MTSHTISISPKGAKSLARTAEQTFIAAAPVIKTARARDVRITVIVEQMHLPCMRAARLRHGFAADLRRRITLARSVVIGRAGELIVLQIGRRRGDGKPRSVTASDRLLEARKLSGWCHVLPIAEIEWPHWRAGRGGRFGGRDDIRSGAGSPQHRQSKNKKVSHRPCL